MWSAWKPEAAMASNGRHVEDRPRHDLDLVVVVDAKGVAVADFGLLIEDEDAFVVEVGVDSADEVVADEAEPTGDQHVSEVHSVTPNPCTGPDAPHARPEWPGGDVGDGLVRSPGICPRGYPPAYSHGGNTHRG